MFLGKCQACRLPSSPENYLVMQTEAQIGEEATESSIRTKHTQLEKHKCTNKGGHASISSWLAKNVFNETQSIFFEHNIIKIKLYISRINRTQGNS